MAGPRSRWRARLTGATALAVLGLAAGLGVSAPGPAAASGEDDAPADAPAVQPLEGQEVELSQRLQGATALSAGRYTSRLSTRDLYLKVERTLPDTTIWVGLTVLTDEASDSSLYAELYGANRSTEPCGTTGEARVGNGTEGTGFASGLLSSAGAEECRGDDFVTVRIGAPLSGTDDTPSWGEDTPLQIVVWEEPAAADTSELPDPEQELSLAAPAIADVEQIAPGPDPASAPVLEDGSYELATLAAGTSVVAVDLEPGQYADVRATSLEDTDALILNPRWVGPMGGSLILPYERSEGGLLLNADNEALWSSPRVNWRNRELEPLEDFTGDTAPAVFGGRHFLVLDLAKSDQREVPLRLDVAVRGQALEDPPYYATAADAFGTRPPGLIDTATEPVDEGASTEAVDADASAGTPWTVVGGLLVAALGLGVAGVLCWNQASSIARPARRGV